MMIEAVRLENCYGEASLFVFRDNIPAYQCYLSLGFTVTDYPDDAPLKERCYFLTRPIVTTDDQPG